MRRAVLLFVGAAAIVTLVIAGASVLDIAGSNTAPGSAKGDAACAGPLHVENPVSNGGHDNNQIVHMTITGNMTGCEDQTMLVEVDNDGTGGHAYAIHQFTNDTTTALDLIFNATTGVFYDTYPTASGGTLVNTGSRVAPLKAKDFGLYTVTIASTWE